MSDAEYSKMDEVMGGGDPDGVVPGDYALKERLREREMRRVLDAFAETPLLEVEDSEDEGVRRPEKMKNLLDQWMRIQFCRYGIPFLTPQGRRHDEQ